MRKWTSKHYRNVWKLIYNGYSYWPLQSWQLDKSARRYNTKSLEIRLLPLFTHNISDGYVYALTLAVILFLHIFIGYLCKCYMLFFIFLYVIYVNAICWLTIGCWQSSLKKVTPSNTLQHNEMSNTYTKLVNMN